ncbi:MAG TPA: hypothetical protein VMY18_01265 [Acidobacteriota bacterium]|nr:hypothetical protein [Acidobacteriota bacterium]
MRPFTSITIFVLAIVALAHALRAYVEADLKIGGIEIPVWISWPVAGVVAFLALMLWRETRR